MVSERYIQPHNNRCHRDVLILVVMEDGLRVTIGELEHHEGAWVLILVVMEDGLREVHTTSQQSMSPRRLNPCCYGRWSQSIRVKICWNKELDVLILVVMEDGLRVYLEIALQNGRDVLILVVMEDGLRGNHLQVLREGGLCVLILVVMEDGLRVWTGSCATILILWRLNPCCYGRWSQSKQIFISVHTQMKGS